MAQEIVGQADYYGLPQPDRTSAPPPEKVADLLKAPPLWEGPMKIAQDDPNMPGYASPSSTAEDPRGPYVPPRGAENFQGLSGGPQ